MFMFLWFMSEWSRTVKRGIYGASVCCKPGSLTQDSEIAMQLPSKPWEHELRHWGHQRRPNRRLRLLGRLWLVAHDGDWLLQAGVADSGHGDRQLPSKPWEHELRRWNSC